MFLIGHTDSLLRNHFSLFLCDVGSASWIVRYDTNSGIRRSLRTRRNWEIVQLVYVLKNTKPLPDLALSMT